MNIIPFPGFPETQYHKEAQPKTQVVLHFSASSDNPNAVFMGWMSNAEKVATCDAMNDKGDVYRCFDPKYYGAHVGFWIRSKGKVVGGNSAAYALVPEFQKLPDDGPVSKQQFNLAIEKRTIGLEVLNWGFLTFKEGKFYNYVGREVPKEKVVTYDKPYRGAIHFEKATLQEIDGMDKWIRTQCAAFGIPLTFSGSFDVNANAINNKVGITLHSNFRADKHDWHPQPELVQMLKAF